MTDREITFEWLQETASGNAITRVIDAIDLASDQDQATWITAEGRRIAKIAPVDEIPDGLLRRITEDEITRLAASELDELLEFAGQIRAAMRTTRDAYDALFGASGARLLRADRPRYPLTENQPVLFLRQSEERGWEQGTFIRYDGASDTVLQDGDGHPVILDRRRVIPAVPEELGETLAAKRAETEPVWQAGMAGTNPESLPVSRGLLTQLLTDAGLSQDKAVTVWNALWSLTLGIHPDGHLLSPLRNDRQSIPQAGCGSRNPHPQHLHTVAGGTTVNCPGSSGRSEYLRPAGGMVTVQVVRDALSLAGIQVSEEAIRGWSNGQASAAYDWAMREHLHASDNDVVRKPRPQFIPGAESGS